jgi:serine/threonine-protein kinase
MADGLPKRIGRYEIRGKIAEGGMATVYAGAALGPGGFERLVAVKVIKSEYANDKSFVNMFLDEARLAARLTHPNVVQIHELGEGEELPGGRKRLYMVMELVAGESLWDVWHVARAKKAGALLAGEKWPLGEAALPADVIAYLGARIAEGLHHAHELREGGRSLGVVHRDVNASNVLVTYDGQVKIIDFGLAKALNRISETGFGVLKGKLAYMAPEQARGARDLDRRADVFALGATLWELSTDQRLFKRDNHMDTLAAVNAAVVPDPRTVDPAYSPALWAILERALRKDREERWPTALEMARELDAFSRSRGRVVTGATVAELMSELFGKEREHFDAWIEAASSKEPPTEPLHSGSIARDEIAELVGQITKPQPQVDGNEEAAEPEVTEEQVRAAQAAAKEALAAAERRSGKTRPAIDRGRADRAKTAPGDGGTSPAAPPLFGRTQWIGLALMIALLVGLAIYAFRI